MHRCARISVGLDLRDFNNVRPFAQIGRIRALLVELGITEDTFSVLTSDNGPELNYGGHDCVPFPNPGSTGVAGTRRERNIPQCHTELSRLRHVHAGGLVGRKRALTEGGIRVPGIVEYPRLVKTNRVDAGGYPVSTMDLLPTLRKWRDPKLMLHQVVGQF